MIREGRRKPVGTDYFFEFYIPNLLHKRLLLFVLNINKASDENDVTDQSYLLLLK